MITIREAKLEDAERLVEIYSHYVLNTAVSFEYVVPTVAEFQERMKKIMGKLFMLWVQLFHLISKRNKLFAN